MALTATTPSPSYDAIIPSAASSSVIEHLPFMAGAILMMLLGMAGEPAYARIHRQIDPVTRVTIYSNYPFPAQRQDHKVALPAPQEAPAPSTSFVPDTRPLRTLVPARELAPTKPAPSSRLVPPTYRGFPRVSPETQKERDSERRRILMQELAWEQAKLDQAIENKAASDVVQRHRANIEALHREISSVR